MCAIKAIRCETMCAVKGIGCGPCVPLGSALVQSITATCHGWHGTARRGVLGRLPTGFGVRPTPKNPQDAERENVLKLIITGYSELKKRI